MQKFTKNFIREAVGAQTPTTQCKVIGRKDGTFHVEVDERATLEAGVTYDEKKDWWADVVRAAINARKTGAAFSVQIADRYVGGVAIIIAIVTQEPDAVAPAASDEEVTQEIDVAWDCPLQSMLKFIEEHGGRIVKHTAVGPGGGNPCLVIALPNVTVRDRFLTAYHAINSAAAPVKKAPTFAEFQASRVHSDDLKKDAPDYADVCEEGARGYVYIGNVVIEQYLTEEKEEALLLILHNEQFTREPEKLTELEEVLYHAVIAEQLY